MRVNRIYASFIVDDCATIGTSAVTIQSANEIDQSIFFSHKWMHWNCLYYKNVNSTHSSDDVNHFDRHCLWYRCPHDVTTIASSLSKLVEHITQPTDDSVSLAWLSMIKFQMFDMKSMKCFKKCVQKLMSFDKTGYSLHITHWWWNFFVWCKTVFLEHLRFRYCNIAFDDIVFDWNIEIAVTAHSWCIARLKWPLILGMLNDDAYNSCELSKHCEMLVYF